LPKVLKPPLSRSNSTSSIGTSFIGTASAGLIINNGIDRIDIGIDPYKLNKLNMGKPGFIKDREIIIRYKFKYFKKSNKKGQVFSGQLFVAIRL
jgi:hypothetical protein